MCSWMPGGWHPLNVHWRSLRRRLPGDGRLAFKSAPATICKGSLIGGHFHAILGQRTGHQCVRLLHNLPDPVNHDIVECPDTARNELKKVGLDAPQFDERANVFVVTVKHQRITSLEDVVIEHLREHPDARMTNRLTRQLSGEDDVNKVKQVLQKLRSDGRIRISNEESAAFNYEYARTLWVRFPPACVRLIGWVSARTKRVIQEGAGRLLALMRATHTTCCRKHSPTQRAGEAIPLLIPLPL